MLPDPVVRGLEIEIEYIPELQLVNPCEVAKPIARTSIVPPDSQVPPTWNTLLVIVEVEVG